MDAPPPIADVVEHVGLLISSYHRFTGRYLLSPGLNVNERVQALWDAPFVVASHDTQADPVFNYGNQAALTLFEMTREQFTSLPSRLSAEPMLREERQALLERVRRFGFIDDYCGVRISASGRRFRIERATVWSLIDENGADRGQAVMFGAWSDVSPGRA
jgi:hypothetical protein